MKKFFLQYKIQVTIALFIFVFLPLSFFVGSYLRSLIAQDINQKQQYQIEQELKNTGIQNIPELKRQVEFINDNKHKINLLLKDSLGAKTRLYKQIEDLSNTLGNVSIDLSPEEYKTPASSRGKDKKEKDTTTFSVTPASENFLYLNISVVGTYNDIIALLEKIDNMQYLSDVLAIDIVAHKNTTSTNDADTTEARAREHLVDAHIYVVFYLDGSATTDSAQNTEGDRSAPQTTSKQETS